MSYFWWTSTGMISTCGHLLQRELVIEDSPYIRVPRLLMFQKKQLQVLLEYNIIDSCIAGIFNGFIKLFHNTEAL